MNIKKISLLIALVVSFLFANQLTTVYSYQNAVYKAKKENKLVLVMMSYDGCPVCAYMKDIVFERPAVLDYLNQHYFVVIKDIEKGHYPQRFSSVDSPTFFFVDPTTEEETIEKKVGGFTPERFLAILKEANHDIDINATVATEQNATEQNATKAPCRKKMPCREEAKVTIQ
ncbi:MAG: hypothetical protein DSZ05_04325 [Sulfurospirillum sp.]|nr:MAG: hypothetical protein DSZ05_04325 [Sulfurospirillum sp.]